MTRDEAAAEATRRNAREFRRTGDLPSVWAELEVRPGVWEVVLYEKRHPPLWRRMVRGLVEFALDPDGTDESAPDPPRWVPRRPPRGS